MSRLGTSIPTATDLAVLDPDGPAVTAGPGAVASLPHLLAGVGRSHVLVVTDAGLRAAGVLGRVLAALGPVPVTCWDAVPANPSTGDVEAGAAVARATGSDTVVVAVGGGSVLDAAKGVALLATNPSGALEYALGRFPDRPGLPLVAVPTTAGTGAETNGFAVLEHPQERRKVYLGDDSVRPRHAVLDPELLLGLPPAATAATGIDALVHGIESLAARGADPVSTACAGLAVELVSGSLAPGVRDGSDLEVRYRLLLGSHLAGRALSRSGLGLVHGIAHAVTAHTGAVHGLALGAVLDEVMSRTLDVAGDAYARAAGAMGLAVVGTDDGTAAAALVAGVATLAAEVSARPPLRDLGVRPEMVPAVARAALADPVSRNHPRTFTLAEVEDVLAARW